MAEQLNHTELRYGTHNDLQTISVWTFPGTYPSADNSSDKLSAADAKKYWLVYIHGGAWRDPRSQKETFLPTMSLLTSSSATKDPRPFPVSRIAGFASINYRLSPHPDFPQDFDTLPDAAFRVAKHPDHLCDVYNALCLLQDTYGYGAEYIVIGHSCGATLALQLLMDTGSDLPLPRAILALEGLYDLDGMNERTGGAMAEINTGAFGPERETWRRVSPACCGQGWTAKYRGLIVLGWSPEDELVDEGEIVMMEKVLAREEGTKYLVYKDLKGRHDEIRDDGREIVRLLGEVLKTLDEE